MVIVLRSGLEHIALLLHHIGSDISGMKHFVLDLVVFFQYSREIQSDTSRNKEKLQRATRAAGNEEKVFGVGEGERESREKERRGVRQKRVVPPLVWCILRERHVLL